MRATFGILLAAVAAGAWGQEYWHFGKPYRMYGVYVRRYMSPNVLSSSGNGEQYSKGAIEFNLNSKNSYSDEATGNLEVKVQEVFLNGAACKRYVSSWDDLPIREDDLRRMDRAAREKAVFGKTNRTYESVVDPDGRVLMTYSDHRDGYGRVQIWAKFNKDDIELTIQDRKGTQKRTVNPALGTEAFVNPIPALLKTGDKDREPRKFCTIDPKNGGILTHTVRYRTRFSGTLDRKKITGSVFELETPNGRRLLFVSDQGELLQVDYDNERNYINAIFASDIG